MHIHYYTNEQSSRFCCVTISTRGASQNALIGVGCGRRHTIEPTSKIGGYNYHGNGGWGCQLYINQALSRSHVMVHCARGGGTDL